MSVTVVCRIRPRVGSESNQADGFTVTGNRLQFRQPEKDEVAFKAIYGQDATFKEVYTGHVSHLVSMFLQGYNSCLLAFGPTGSGKSYIIEGSKGTRGGLVPCIIEGIFSQLQRRVLRPSETPPKLYFSMCEIYNELVTDLQNKNNRDMEVVVDESVGAFVRDLTRREVSDMNECLNYFFEAKTNRTNIMTDLGPTSQRASAIFTLELHQELSEAARKMSYVSKFMVVDLAGAEKLAEDLTALRLREGPTLNKSLVSFGRVVESLSSPQEIDFADYSESKLTMLLQDALGGNCNTVVITTLKPTTEPIVALCVARMARMLSGVVNHFVPNDEFLRALLRKYRSNLLRLREKLDLYKGSTAMSGHDPSSKLLKMHELEGQIIKDNLEKTKMREENEKIYEKLVEMRAKYNDLVAVKADLSSNLIGCEEERLKVSKALVDLQIENTRLREESESKLFELQNKTLNLENDVLELELIKEKLEKANGSFEEEIRKSRQEMKELSDEFVVLKSNFLSLTREHEKDVTKAEELGLELLNLVNTKAALLKEKDAYLLELEKLRSQNEGLSLVVTSCEQQEAERGRELQQLRGEVERVGREMMNRQVENGQAVLKLENRKLELERQVLELTKMKDSDLCELKAHHDKEVAGHQSEQQKQQKELAECRRRAKKAERRCEELVEDSTRLSGELAVVKTQLSCVAAQSRDQMDAYRERLQKYIKDITLFIAKAKSKDDPRVQAQLQSSVDGMLKEITRTYREKEAEYLGSLGEAEREKEALMERHGRLLAAYRRIRDDLAEGEDRIEEEEAAAFEGGACVGAKRGDQSVQEVRDALGALEAENAGLKERLLEESEVNRGLIGEVQGECGRVIEEMKGVLDSRMAVSGDEKERKILLQQKVIANYEAMNVRENKKVLTTEISRLKQENSLLRNLLKTRSSTVTSESMATLQRQFREFTASTQMKLEKERSQLLVKCTLAEEQLSRMQEFVSKNLTEYQREISRLSKRLQERSDKLEGL